MADKVLLCRVSPFGNLRINAYLQLPAAYRSLSRPSSALSAKAFPLRSLQLDLFCRWLSLHAFAAGTKGLCPLDSHDFFVKKSSKSFIIACGRDEGFWDTKIVIDFTLL